MKTGRLEAFSDGVLAIIITIMVLEIKVPSGNEFSNLYPLFPKFLSYLLSFIYVGIYWNNHHHLLQAINKVNGGILWANLSLLFSLSLLPFSTAWLGENHFIGHPATLYGINLLLCSITFTILERIAIKSEGNDSKISKAVQKSFKENLSSAVYAIGIISSFFIPYICIFCYFFVAILWIIPDKRIENQLN